MYSESIKKIFNNKERQQEINKDEAIDAEVEEKKEEKDL